MVAVREQNLTNVSFNLPDGTPVRLKLKPELVAADSIQKLTSTDPEAKRKALTQMKGRLKVRTLDSSAGAGGGTGAGVLGEEKEREKGWDLVSADFLMRGGWDTGVCRIKSSPSRSWRRAASLCSSTTRRKHQATF